MKFEELNGSLTTKNQKKTASVSISRQRAQPAMDARKGLADNKREWAKGRMRSNLLSGRPYTSQSTWDKHNKKMDNLEAEQKVLKKKGYPKPVSPSGRQSGKDIMEMFR